MKSLLLILTLSLAMISHSQADEKVEQYCKLVATGRMLSNKVTIDVDFGEERKLFSGDKRLRDETTGKLKKFNSTTDALNYMGAQGWSLVNAFPMPAANGEIYHFYFKRLFSKTEVDKQTSD
jgi:hypothetical protein